MTAQDVPARPDLPAVLLDLPAALLHLLDHSIPREHSTFDWKVQIYDGATVFMLRYEDGTKPQPKKSKAQTGKKWKKKARVDPATRPTDTTDSRKKKKADPPPSSDTTAISGSKPDAPVRKNGPFQGHTVFVTAEVTPGPVRKRKTRCRQKRDSRKWDEYVVRVMERRAARLDSPGAAQGAPSPPQAVASREPEPEPSPALLRPLAHRVDTRPPPDPPASTHLLGCDSYPEANRDVPCTECDDDYIPSTRDPVYTTYKRIVPPIQVHKYCKDSCKNCYVIVKCLYNTSTNSATLWYQEPYDEKIETRPASTAMKLRYLQPKYELHLCDHDLEVMTDGDYFVYPEAPLMEPSL
jgi:hypothetical protein